PIDPTNPYNYYRASGQAFGPNSYSTRYACAYSASGQSASDRMSNGNIFVNASGGQGGAGVMYEVDQNGTIIWGPNNADTQKAFRYECEYPGIVALEPYMNSTSTSSCFSTSINDLEEDIISIYPNPTSDIIHINLSDYLNQYYEISLTNSIGQFVYNQKNMISTEINKIELYDYPKGIYTLNIVLQDGRYFSKKIALIK
ncbi:MAG: T9SS type A sorting domain-containing protein, partial [Flavobacteriales bacterium]|nr:T9SS type A sorting domain-containing protein [Flavobacteriales bacterium]